MTYHIYMVTMIYLQRPKPSNLMTVLGLCNVHLGLIHNEALTSAWTVLVSVVAMPMISAVADAVELV